MLLWTEAMSTTNVPDKSRTVSSSKTRHSKEDALDEREFELLLEGATSLRDPYGQQGRFAVLLMGRLGLRLGELTHLREEWVNWRKRMIEIPRHSDCQKGRDGGACSLCVQQARQQADRLEDVTEDDLLPQFWRSKTDAAARAIPFDFSPRCEIAIERFFDRYDEWPHSHSALRRRVEKAAEEARELKADELYPHCLRASAATYHAGRGLPVLALKGLLGWADPSTADAYVAQSPENTARALHQIHSR